MFERRAFDLSRPRALRAPGSEYFLHQSLASTASFSKRVTVLKFLVIIAGKNSRERKKRREKKKQREKNSRERERAFLKNTNTIYDIKYAAIFHVQNDVRVPRRHFSFHRHLTHVSSLRREHFTFHFLLSFNVYLCLLIMCFLVVVCSSFLFFRVFFTRTRTKNQIKRYLETSARANKKRTTREDFGWIKKKMLHTSTLLST